MLADDDTLVVQQQQQDIMSNNHTAIITPCSVVAAISSEEHTAAAADDDVGGAVLTTQQPHEHGGLQCAQMPAYVLAGVMQHLWKTAAGVDGDGASADERGCCYVADDDYDGGRYSYGYHSYGGHMPKLPRWCPAVSAAVRRVCKGWQEVHDGLISTVEVKVTCNNSRLNSIPQERSSVWRKFTGVKTLTIVDRREPFFDEKGGYAVTGYFVEDAEAQLKAVAAQLTGLIQLDLRELTGLTPKGIRALAPLTALATLTLCGSCMTDDSLRHSWAPCLEALTSLAALTCLGLGSMCVTDDRLRALGSLTGLTELDMGRYCYVDVHWRIYAEVCQTMDRPSSGDVTVEGFKDLARLTALTTLRLYGGSFPRLIPVTGPGCLRALAPLTALTRLAFGRHTYVTDEDLSVLATFTGLTDLDMSSIHGDKVTDAGMKRLASLTGLTSLRLFHRVGRRYSRPIQLRFLRVATLAPLTSLTRLDLGRRYKLKAISEEDLAALRASLPGLTDLTRPPPVDPYTHCGDSDDELYEGDLFTEDEEDLSEEDLYEGDLYEDDSTDADEKTTAPPSDEAAASRV
jgi:hypothetical protein